MTEPLGQENRASNSTQEIMIGGGDPLRIIAFEEIATNSQTGDAEIKKLPDEALAQVTEQLKGLPFAIGEKHFIGTPDMRNKHDVVVRVAPRAVAYNAPESENGKYTIYFRFGERAGQHGLHLNTHNKLNVVQQRDSDGQMSTITSFSLDLPFDVAGKEVREVVLVMPVEQLKPGA